MGDLLRAAKDGEKGLTIPYPLVSVEAVDRVWFCSYNLPLRWEAGDFACNPDNPRTGADCTDKCGWYLVVEADDE